jgi:hypothetical protein
MILKILKQIHWLVCIQFGINPNTLILALRGIPSFLRDLVLFNRMYTGKICIKPCLHDRFEEAAPIKNEYFWQDLVVARFICENKPVRHVDIGSRFDGFVSHLASFRECEVLDIRPIKMKIPGVVFKQADLMDSATLPIEMTQGYCDSLSCLHSIEHFGLGRYGDPINPDGYKEGIKNMAGLLKSGGVFYLSTPIGKERVEFNANWVFDPRTIINYAEKVGLVLNKLIIINKNNSPTEININPSELKNISLKEYNLGLFIFYKL